MENTTDFGVLYDKLNHIEQKMVTREELEQVVETICVLSNSDTMSQIAQSEQDICNGDFKEIDSIEDL